MTEAFTYAIAGLLLVQALLRCRSAIRGRSRERSLWGAFAALAGSGLARTGPVHDLLNTTGIPDLAYLVKHLLAIVALCVLLRYVTSVYQDADRTVEASRSARIAASVHRIAARAVIGTILVMTVIFFTSLSTPDTNAAPHFMARHAGEPGLAIYMSLFYAYTTAGAAVCAMQWGAARHHAPIRSLRVGLAMMSAGAVTLVAYSVARVVYVVLLTVDPVSVSDSVAAKQEMTTDSLLYTGFLLWVIGSIAPAAYAGRARYRTYHSLIALHPLWRDLALVVPDVVRHQPSRVLAGTRLGAIVTSVRDLAPRGESSTAQLSRWVVEIRDVIHELRRHAPADLAERALLRAEYSKSTAADDPRIRAEAYWIRAALTTYSVEPPGVPAPFPFAADDGLSAEVRHLQAVTARYTRTTIRDAQALLATGPASAPATAHSPTIR
ncbi:MAB_1171c family putative transporter [Streptomyces jumonjinensis]|uniref:MAB_1171c family putative transporter n=1 Tax=Streptomyces jumonjinensis TaxID=1945 RepID=UPI0037A46DB9